MGLNFMKLGMYIVPRSAALLLPVLIMIVWCPGKKGKAFPLQALGVQEVEAPEFLNNRQMKVVRLSALRTGRL
jgi:hypothetical protein